MLVTVNVIPSSLILFILKTEMIDVREADHFPAQNEELCLALSMSWPLVTFSEACSCKRMIEY
jgi:hypothetical protein